MHHMPPFDRMDQNFFDDIASSILMLNMVQFHRSQIFVDRQSAPLVDPGHWTLDRAFAIILSLKWGFYVLHSALMAVTLDKMHLLGSLSPISSHLHHGLESWRENTPLQEFALT